MMARKIAIEEEVIRRGLYGHTAIPDVFRPLLRPSRYKGAYGGRGSAKSHFFGELLLGECCRTETRAVCLREHQVSLEQSVKRLLEDKIETYKLDDRFGVFNNHIEGPHDSLIIFQGMKDHTADSIKSLEGYRIAWFEEAQTCSDRSLTLLRPTIREEGSEIWFSWNPRFKTDPVDLMFRGSTHPDAIVVKSTWQDNPYFPDVLRREMEWDRGRDPEKYAHVWMGEYEQHSEARVFKNWSVEEFETPANVNLYFGADWGYSVDPSVLVRFWVKEKTLYIDYEAYQIGCELDDLPKLFDQIPGSRQWDIIADSSRPDTISHLKHKHKFAKIKASKKGKDSVKEGVIFLQTYDIKIHPRCKHTIDEFTMYRYKTDPLTNMVTPILEDKKNHVIDSVRYAAERLRKPQYEATW